MTVSTLLADLQLLTPELVLAVNGNGSIVGATDGDKTGSAVGSIVGKADGDRVGASVGSNVGAAVG